MKAATQTSPAKLILLGEHAVVYGQPAIAVPLKMLRAEAAVASAPEDEPVSVALDDFKRRWAVGESPTPDEAAPFARLLELVAAGGKVPKQGWRLEIRSRIPIGCGLGSSASVCAASFRAIHSAFDLECSPEQLAERLYETERIMHGTPSGIDNTVIALERPVFFQRGSPIRMLRAPAAEAFLVVGDTGMRHKTREVVGAVRRAWMVDPLAYDKIFAEIGKGTSDGAKAFEAADWPALGALMNRNQELLERLDVSNEKLVALIQAARKAGALGAKLSGAGRGGCMVALAKDAEHARVLRAALQNAGAVLSIASGIVQ